MDTTIIVAVNKMDKVDESRLDVILRDLSNHGLLPEQWGGDIVVVPISAKTGSGVDKLLEMIALQAELLELKADPLANARGFILESKVEKGRGPVATLICKHGTVKVGDLFVCGKTVGKVSSLVNSQNKRLKQAGPSVPVLVAGFEALPEAGDFFEVVSLAEYKKRRFDKPERKISTSLLSSADETINLIIKADTHSSLEAIVDSIKKIKPEGIGIKEFNFVNSGVGGISEGDVILATDTKSLLLGFNVKADSSAVTLAKKNKINISIYHVIYKLLEELKEVAESTKEIQMISKKTGEAIVRKSFQY